MKAKALKRLLWEAYGDALLGMEPSDWDIATNALPELLSQFSAIIRYGHKAAR